MLIGSFMRSEMQGKRVRNALIFCSFEKLLEQKRLINIIIFFREMCVCALDGRAQAIRSVYTKWLKN